jgi:S1-C subfamily serine protease
MKLVRFVAPALAALAWGGTALAQGDQDAKERLKKEIVKAVEEMLRAEEDRILKSVDEMLKEEFGKLQKQPEPQQPPARKARGYLGIRPAELSDDEREELGLKDDEGGIRIAEVLPDTPAAKAGLENDDVIVRVDGRSFEGVQGVVSLIGSKSAGQKVVFTIIRDGARKDIEVTLMRHPDDPEEQRPQPPERQPAKEENPSTQKEGELRERIRKFLDKEAPPKEEKKDQSGPPGEGENPKGFEGIFRRLRDTQGIDELLQQMRDLIEKMGGQAPDAQQMLEQLNEQIRRMIEGLGEGRREPAPEPAPAPAPKADTRRPYLGVLVEPLAAEEAKKAGLGEGEGLYVSEVREGSPAAKAGLRKGDILVRLRGNPVKGELSLRQLMSSSKAGDKIEITVLREGKEIALQATLGAK